MSNYPMYRTDFKLVRSVTNRIEFFLRDIDRKFTTLTGRTFAIKIMDLRANRLLLSRNLTVVNANQGLMRLTISPADMVDWPTAYHRWSVVMTEGGVETVLWTDRGYGPYGWLEMVDGPIPLPLPPVTVEAGDLVERNDFLWTAALPGAASVGRPEGIHTFAAYLTDFTGSLVVQGSLEDQPSADDADWFDIQTEDFEDETGTNSFSVTASLMWVRVKVDQTSGTLDKLTFRN